VEGREGMKTLYTTTEGERREGRGEEGEGTEGEGKGFAGPMSNCFLR